MKISEIFSERTGIKGDELDDMMRFTVEEFQLKNQLFKNALKHKDFDLIKEEIHKLKSLFAYLDDNLYQKFKSFDIQCKNENEYTAQIQQQAENLLLELEKFYQLIIQEVK